MVDIKNNFSGGLDLDTSFYNLERNKYVDALNVSRDAVEANEDGGISNIVGNRLFDYTLPAGDNKTIGAYPNTLRNSIVSFVYNNNNHHSIINYDLTTRASTKIFESLLDSATDILGFTETGKITGINIFNRDEGDFLIFLDSLGRPTVMNITRFIAGEYTPVTRDIIDLGKRPPLTSPTGAYGNDLTRVANNFFKKITRYQYRWVYDDDFKSTGSPIGQVPLPVNILDPTYSNIITNNNSITLSLNSGPKNVKAVELWLSISEASNQFERFVLAKTFNKAEESIADDIDFSYIFYNDSTYPFLSDSERLLLFDWVPDKAVAQEMPNGNVIAYGNITEGYDRTLTPNVQLTVNTTPAGTGGSVSTLGGIATMYSTDPIFEYYRLDFTGVPAAGVVVTVKLITTPGGVITTIATYTTIAGDVAASVVAGLAANMTTTGIGTVMSAVGNALRFRYNNIAYNFNSLNITNPATSTSANSVATWKWSTERHIGIAYFDEKGKTNGILYSGQVSFPNYVENGSFIPMLPYINVKIFHRPPLWAYSYSISFTKEPTQYLFIETVDINTSETDYVYFEITNLGLNQTKNPTTAQVVSWTFQDGDRIRIIKDLVTGNTYGTDYNSAIEGIVVAPTISGVVQTGKTFVKVKKTVPFSTGSFADKFFVIELYRPGQQPPSANNEVYYECGIEFPILEPTTANRRHAGQITDQSADLVTPAEIDIYKGDSYFRSRTMYLTNTGQGTFSIQDRNFVDFYLSAVSSIDGRALSIEINGKQATYPALVRHGEAYQANTSINGLNRFYPVNFLDCDYSFGGIMRFTLRDRLLKVFQMNKIGRIPLYNQISKDNVGNAIEVGTDQLLNPVQYYIGNWGIGTAGTSLATFNFADYFADNIRGVIVRSSNDGLTPISVVYNVNSFASSNLPLRISPYFIYGAYDQKLNNFILALEQAGVSEAKTITFSEAGDTSNQPSFESFLSLKPEMMATVGNMLCSFKNGAMWTHDNDRYNSFFGVDYESSIKPVFNDGVVLGKTYESIEQFSNDKWDCPEIETQARSFNTTKQRSNLVAAEFVLLENAYKTSFKRDTNSNGGKWNGQFLKGSYMSVVFRKQEASSLSTLNIVGIYYIPSNLNSR